MQNLSIDFNDVNGMIPLNQWEASETNGGNFVYDFFYGLGYAAHFTVALIQDIRNNPLPPGDTTPYPVR